MLNYNINDREKEWLRELAKRQLEYANLPIMKERERLWKLHNALKGERPMIVMEEETFLSDILPPPKCENSIAKVIEHRLMQTITAFELFDDDKVISANFPVDYKLDMRFLGMDFKKTFAQDGIGFHIDEVIEDLEEDLEKLTPTVFSYDHDYTDQLMQSAEEIIGDILPVIPKNGFNYWWFSATQRVVELMGMENMFCSMVSEADYFHQLMRLITDDFIRCLRWQEENNLLLLNNGNDYMGSGSYCFSDELPGPDFNGTVRSTNLWGHMNSQESIGVSPEMYADCIFPYYKELAAQFGLLYYGCCEPVHAYWDDCISQLPGLRKVSISPWCDEKFMAERLSGSKIIYSRKPSPNLIGVEKNFDEEAFSRYIQNTIDLTYNCKVEFIFRDIYKLDGNRDKVRRAVEITRQLTERNG